MQLWWNLNPVVQQMETHQAPGGESDGVGATVRRRADSRADSPSIATRHRGATNDADHEAQRVMTPSQSSQTAGRRPTTTRRSALTSGGLATLGCLVGIPGATATATSAGSETSLWMTHDVPDTPLHSITLPGTHHSAMYNGGPDWWHCQSNDLATQLDDGIRYLDVRVAAHRSWFSWELYHHHGGTRPQPHKWGASLDTAAFPDLRAYLDAVAARGGTELVVLDMRNFWDSRAFRTDDLKGFQYDMLAESLEAHLGDYIFDLRSTSPAELMGMAPSDFDGPRVLPFYRDADRRPSWAGASRNFIHTTKTHPEPGRVLTEAITSPDTDATTFQRCEFQVTPDFGSIASGWFGIKSRYGDLSEAADRTNALLGGYVDAVKRDPRLNPNIVSLDYYETSNVVQYCRELSREGQVGTVLDDSLPVAADVHRMESVDSGLVVDVNGAGTANGVDVQVWEWNETGAQRFEFVPNGDHTYRIRNTNSGKVLDVSGFGTDAGDDVHQWRWHGGDNQRWYVVPVDGYDDLYMLVNKHSGLPLDASNSDSGSTVHQWTLHNGDNQRWYVDEPSEPLASDPEEEEDDSDDGGWWW